MDSLTVVERDGANKHGQATWLCKCECGAKVIVCGSSLRNGLTKSCGCMKRECISQLKGKDLTGQSFGRLTVIARDGVNIHGKTTWICKCECGKECIVTSSNLRTGRTASCGCLQRDWAKEAIKKVYEKVRTHGMSRTRLYSIWQGIRVRTGNKKGAHGTSLKYIERGIALCEEWKTFEPFRDWALSHGYTDDLQIDRIDNNGDYTPDNCRFVTCRENLANRNFTRKYNGVAVTTILTKLGIETFDSEKKQQTKEFTRVSHYFDRHNGNLPPDIKARYEEYLRQIKE